MADVTGFNTKIHIIADQTFPLGFTITQASDDADPIAFSSVKIGDGVMGANGNLITWRRGVPLPVTIAVVPGSIDDVNLQALFNANRVARGKASANDNITLTVVYPDDSTVVLTGGIITDGMPGKTFQSSGRLGTRSYAFIFENNAGA